MGMNDSELVEYLVDRYLQDHPDYEYPESSSHPLVIAMGTTIRYHLIEQVGGVVAYWRMILGAAQRYFVPKEESVEYDAFIAQFTLACVYLDQSDSHCDELKQLYEEYQAWLSERKQ